MAEARLILAKKVLPNTEPAVAPEPMLAEVPDVIRDQGRVAGFEHLRDRMLSDWEKFIKAGVNAYSALKLVIEMDRHAMFAEVQAEKKKGEVDQQKWDWYQKYLQGQVDAAPLALVDEPDNRSTRTGGQEYNPMGELEQVGREYEESDGEDEE